MTWIKKIIGFPVVVFVGLTMPFWLLRHLKQELEKEEKEKGYGYEYFNQRPWLED